MPLDERIGRCVEIKVGFVAADEREGGSRALLNYGHTLAHALEIATAHDLTHGEAVGIGLVYAAELAAALGDQLLDLMGRDKKARAGLTFVLDGPRGVEVVGGVDPAVARAALAAVR
jgi:5-deoxy-5-amino-3-dehydroquinate synthase